MATTQEREQDREKVRQQRQKLNAHIGTQVLHTLGEPGDLQRVQVMQLWDDRYRVNIVTGENVISVRIAHSYFLVADGDGNIVSSIPAITKQY